MLVKNRYQAFAAHLLGSAGVALVSAVLVFAVWYAWPLANAAGVNEIFLLLLAVDVVVGPVITLIVFNLKKKELKRDLFIVLLLQLSALAYGMHTVFIARPVYMVFVVDRFDLVYANDLDDDKLAKVTDPAFKTLPLWRPRTVSARQPEDRETRQKLMFDTLAGGPDLQELPQFYEPYTKAVQAVQGRIQDMSKLHEFNAHAKPQVAALLAEFAAYPGGVGFLPLRGKVEDQTVVLSRNSGEVLKIARVKPWP